MRWFAASPAIVCFPFSFQMNPAMRQHLEIFGVIGNHVWRAAVEILERDKGD
jgi:hypothetical protein